MGGELPAAVLQDTVDIELDGITPCLLSGKGCQGHVLPPGLSAFTLFLWFPYLLLPFLTAWRYHWEPHGHSGFLKCSMWKCFCQKKIHLVLQNIFVHTFDHIVIVFYMYI